MAENGVKSPRFGSADELAQLIPAVRLRDWMALAITALCFGFLGIWCLAGTVPTNVTGRGILIQPRQPIVQAQALAGGRVVRLDVRLGDIVRKGQLIGRVDQSDVLRRIQEDQARIADLQTQDSVKTAADQQRLSLQAEQDSLEKKSLEVQRATLLQSLRSAEALVPVLEKRNDAVRELIRNGLIGPASREVPEAAAAVSENRVRMEDLKSRLGIIDGQLKQIETRAATQAREILEISMTRRNEIENIRRAIEVAQTQLNRNGEILSDTAGRVIEVLAIVGQVLPSGGPLITMEAQDADHTLTSITYLSIADGKKVEPGMQVQITPDLVERQRFGGIVGTVVSVSSTPATREGAMSLIGNAEVVQALLSGGGHMEVISRVETDPSTYSRFRWSSSSGPKLKITSGTTTTTRIRVEDRAPVTYLLPILRATSGIY